MNKLSLKLGLRGIKANKFLYIPFILASSLMIFIFNLIADLKTEDFILNSRGGAVIESILNMGSYVIVLFAALFLIYMSKSIMKSSFKELGLLYSLGMDKGGLSGILIFQNLILGMLSIFIGSFISFLLGPLFISLIGRFLNEEIEVTFKLLNIGLGALVFGLIFLLITIISLFSIRRKNPLELSKLSKKGESEPRVNVVVFLLSIFLIGYGYSRALNIENSFDAIKIFLPAIIAVIVGTFLFFRSVLIWILKLLRKNKKIYYKSTNMTFIGELIKRSKESAMSLASISIISSMLLLSFVIMVSMFFGKERLLDKTAPKDYAIGFDLKDEKAYQYSKENLEKIIDKKDIKDSGFVKKTHLMAKDEGKGDFEILDGDSLKENMTDSKTRAITLTDIHSFNKANGENIELKKGEVLVYDSKNTSYEKISLGGIDFNKVKNIKDTNYILMDNTAFLFQSVLVVVDDLEGLNEKINDKNPQIMNLGSFYFNIKNKEKSQAYSKKLDQAFEKDEFKDRISLAKMIENRLDFDQIHTGAYVTIILMALMFLASTIVVIYYKQAAEGLDDGREIKILQKIGMSKREIKKSVARQNYFTFFFPLLVSIIHIIVASKLAFGLLEMFSGLSLSSFIKIEAICILIYSLVYILIFRLSLPIYFKMGELNKE